MFGFGNRSIVDRIYSLLEERRVEGQPSARQRFHRDDLVSLWKMCEHDQTCVEMVLLFGESEFSKRYVDQIAYQKLVAEIIELAGQAGVDAGQRVEEEGDQAYSTAKAYADNIADMLENGTMVGPFEVRQFCANQATSMMASWIKYRLRLQSAYTAYLEEHKAV